MTDKAALKAARRAKFEGVFTVIRNELIEHFKGESMPDEAVEWYQKNLDYNVPGGKLNRGLSVVDTVEILQGRELSEDEYFRAAVLGWCVELLQAYFLVADDIMDSSLTRRSQPCWYLLPNIGTIAINDSFMLEAAIYHLLRRYFKKEAYYADLTDVFHETTYQTEMGQLVDLITAPEGKVDLGGFSLERHRLIVIYKTAYYSFYLPVACAMLMSHIPYPDVAPRFPVSKLSPSIPPTSTGAQPQVKTQSQVNGGEGRKEPYATALSILLPLGEYFQIQDDFLDYSAPPEVLGKIGTDIVDNKCSWVINTALLLTGSASPITVTSGSTQTTLGPERLRQLRQILDENYARKDPQGLHEKRVKEVYEELGIRKRYEDYEERVVGELRERIAGIREEGEGAGGLKREVFESFLGKIYRRSM